MFEKPQKIGQNDPVGLSREHVTGKLLGTVTVIFKRLRGRPVNKA